MFISVVPWAFVCGPPPIRRLRAVDLHDLGEGPFDRRAVRPAHEKLHLAART